METVKSTENTSDKVEIEELELKLVNFVCACLIHEPRYYSSAENSKAVLGTLVEQLAAKDPEFVLKLSLYVRDDLNIRSTANYLLALAANLPPCQPFLKKYFNTVIRLPSDLLEVVTLYLHLNSKYLKGTAIPTALRKVAALKFPQFDVYQLAKYNKEKAQKKKNKKQKEKMDIQPAVPAAAAAATEEEKKPTPLTLKQLIRKIHLAQPAEPVMMLLGKRYPTTEEAFVKTGLPGKFDPQRANKRMKLPTPETWETLLSAKGNKHTTWEELIDHRKLPFMAMLRNLRNLIITGISPKHHEIVLNRLTDEKSVANSRQLPWRFLSAYQAINIDLEQLMNDILDHDGSGEKIIQVPVKGKKGKQMGATRTIRKRVIIPVNMPDMPLIQRYREAIDTAIRLSTMHNLKPIEGNTVVFCDVSGSMKCKCSTRGNLGSIQEVFEIGILLGLMLQDCCEQCDFRVFSSPGRSKRCDAPVPIQSNTILGNIERVKAVAATLGGGTDFPYEYLDELIAKKVHMDNFIIISDMMIAPGHREMVRQGHTVGNALRKYRQNVNPDLLFVAIDLFGNGKSIVDINSDDPKNVLITGFSDNILRFVAERGGRKQLEYIQTIDEIKLKTPKNNETKDKESTSKDEV